MIHEKIHKQILDHLPAVKKWFDQQSDGLFVPFYSSFDVRDSGVKVAPVDANIFPAGFNNICPTDQESAVEIVRNYFSRHFEKTRKILLLTEEHTHNPYYWDNVATLNKLLTGIGLDVRLAVPRRLSEPWHLTSAAGFQLEVHGSERVGDKVRVGDFEPELIISNNDFSEAHEEWISGLSTPINPPHELGWHQRRKDEFFREYNELAEEFCRLVQMDPWLLRVQTSRFAEFDVNDETSRLRLADAVDQFIANLKAEYQERRIEAEPFVFIKNNAGTYGLGVTQASSGDEVRQWTYKSRKKMKAAKAGRTIEQVIIQDGIPTVIKAGSATAEPTIYMIGCQLAGGFLRTHETKGPRENLNSPGAVFKRLCVSDLKISVEGHPLENVYGWVAKLGLLAIAREAKAHQITCHGFQTCSQI